MLTIGQLADYAGVSVRAVRHYHAKGLLPEPARDQSGYRRYGAKAVADLIKIRTLAESGVPLARVEELLHAGDDEFAAAIDDIDRRLHAQQRELQAHRRQLARLAAGDSLALPAEAVSYLATLRALGIPERMVDAERDAWILVAAQLPDAMPYYMQLKEQQIADPGVEQLYRDLAEVIGWSSDDPRIPTVVDGLVAQFELVPDVAWRDDPLPDELAALLDSVFLESVPAAARILSLLEERGWTGWTKIRRLDDAPGRNGQAAGC